jgi:DNA-binding NtrC family response regulator
MEKPAILFVDDEQRVLRSLKVLFSPMYKVHVTTNGHEAIKLLKTENIEVLVSDQRMPEMLGTELLRLAKEVSPDTMRLLLTGYSDLTAIVGSINEGEIFRYINKPWNNEEIKETIASAMEASLKTTSPPLLSDKKVDVINIEDIEGIDNSNELQDFNILVIDEDDKTYHMINELFSNKYNVKYSNSLSQAFNILSIENISLIISELNINGEDISLSLKMLKHDYPEIITIVITDFHDADALITLINQGQIFRFLLKPFRHALLRISIEAAGKQFLDNKRNPKLLSRYRVEKNKAITENNSLSHKIAGFFSKFKRKKIIT